MLDVAVVGGGPAGLALAIEARRRDLTVAVFDRREPPIDKPCGEGLMPGAMARLAALGVHPAGHLLRGLTYRDAHCRVSAPFPGAPGRGVRRTELHRALVEAAERAGAELHWKARIDGLDDGSGNGARHFSEPRLALRGGGSVRARWVVGADGLRSDVRRWEGLDGPSADRRRFGVRRHYRVRPWSDHVEVWWSQGAEAYVTPVGPLEVGVAVLWESSEAEATGGGFESSLAHFPALSRRLDGAQPTSTDRGCGPLRQQVAGVARGHVALVGDAAGYVDAITGEGIALALEAAACLADALVRGDLNPYAGARRQIVARADRLALRLLFFSRHPRLRAGALRTLSLAPALFERSVGSHLNRQVPTWT
ncbi:MAG: NAD(P)/FAD-dependent oxidoreductase [Acidobacteriota bacterium]